MLRAADSELIQIVDHATADAARRSGHWLLCRPGCTQCCVGVFAINQLDGLRLREGLHSLDTTDPARAEAVRKRAQDSMKRLAPAFPGDLTTGILHESEEFEDFANDEPCPALDPSTGTCDLYASRPMTCRVFGPPIRTENEAGEKGIGICELCFDGATENEILAAELDTSWTALENAQVRDAEEQLGRSGNTIIAFVLAEKLDV